MRRIIPIVIAQFLPVLDIPSGDNPDGPGRGFNDTVGGTGMIDIAGGILDKFAVDVEAVVQGKEIDIALIQADLSFLLGNLFPDILDNPPAVWDLLGRKESRARNA